jgi:serine/threonine protein kinase
MYTPSCCFSTVQCSFQDEYYLFYAFTYIPGGSLYFHLHHQERFSEPMARFYVAQVTLAFEYLHKLNIIYRDLKPENCMLSKEGHLVLVDFGSAKRLDDRARTSTFVGTPHYMAPEVLRGQPYSFSADWWSLGVLLYELLTGEAPFSSNDRIQLYRSVLRADVDYPEFLSPRARDLLSKLIERNTDTRLGSFATSADDHLCIAGIKNHSFFLTKPVSEEEKDKYLCLLRSGSRQSMMMHKVTGAMKRFTRKGPSIQLLYDGVPNTWTWVELENYQVKPPLRPKLGNPLDTQFFDTSITSCPATLDTSERGDKAMTIPNFNYLISMSPSETDYS